MTNRVHLREHIVSDLDAYIDWQTDPGVARYLSWLPRTEPEARDSFLDAINQQNVEGRERFYFAVVLTDTAEVIGDAGFTLVEPMIGDCGWFLQKKFQGYGYATEAVNKLIEYAFQSKGLETLLASCHRANNASIRIMRKCEFILEKQSEDRLWYRQSREIH